MNFFPSQTESINSINTLSGIYLVSFIVFNLTIYIAYHYAPIIQ